jgi:putative membrane protein
MKRRAGGRLFWTLNVLFLVQWLFLAFGVHNRQAWVLENILVVAFSIPILTAYRRAWISDTSYVLLFIFLSLHNLGAHYTYSLVPYDPWFKNFSGRTLNSALGWERNHYDRLLHFLFGLLGFLPLLELCAKIPRIQVSWRPVAALLIIVGWSSLYELIEWLAAIVFSDGAGPEYVGTQGDIWDAQKDQALAIAGALLAWGIIIFRSKLRRKQP